MKIRLDKLLQEAGIASRKKASEIIREGSVLVNGEIVQDPSKKVDPVKEKVYFGNIRVKPAKKKLIYIANKPKGYSASFWEKNNMYHFFKKYANKVYPEAPLPKFASGLILLLNDPEVSEALGKKDLISVYRLKLKGNLTQKDIDKLLRGMKIDEKFVKIDKFLTHYKRGDKVIVLINFTHRYPSMLSKMFLRRDLSLLSMTRLSLGPLKLGKLKGGEAREATPHEVETLRKALELV